MKSSVENLDPTKVKLTVEVPFEEFKPAIDAAAKEIGKQVNIPGFRRGHIPARVIEAQFGLRRRGRREFASSHVPSGGRCHRRSRGERLH